MKTKEKSKFMFPKLSRKDVRNVIILKTNSFCVDIVELLQKYSQKESNYAIFATLRESTDRCHCQNNQR